MLEGGFEKKGPKKKGMRNPGGNLNFRNSPRSVPRRPESGSPRSEAPKPSMGEGEKPKVHFVPMPKPESESAVYRVAKATAVTGAAGYVGYNWGKYIAIGGLAAWLAKPFFEAGKNVFDLFKQKFSKMGEGLAKMVKSLSKPN